MSLPGSFAFSQASLQDYSECARRFQLRYLLELRWPDPHDETRARWEARAQLGADFHRLVHQHTVGIPPDLLAATIADDELQNWWLAYLHTPPPNLPTAIRRSEVRLSTPLEGYRVMARYDLLAVEPSQRAVIVDWKTSQRRPRREWLEKRWQTRVYRYVLVEAGSELNEGEDLAPAQVELLYWYPRFPQQSERLTYGASQFATDQGLLRSTVAEIAAINLDVWPLTDDLRRCRYCTYRTLCDRPAVGGAVEPDEEPSEEAPGWDIDLEQIAEIEF
jgi:hypothetical protein